MYEHFEFENLFLLLKLNIYLFIDNGCKIVTSKKSDIRKVPAGCLNELFPSVLLSQRL